MTACASSSVDVEAIAEDLRAAVARFNTLPLHDHEGRAAVYLAIAELREQMHAAGGKPQELAYAV